MPTLSTLVIMPQQDAAEAAREQASVAREQAQAARDQAQAIRDAVRAARDAGRAERGVVMYPPMIHGPSRRQEGMMFVAFVICVVAAVAILRPIFAALGRRIERAPQRDALAAPGAAERLERIEQAVEAMAVEIERISEGQRFTTRLLTSRAPAELPVSRGGHVDPVS